MSLEKRWDTVGELKSAENCLSHMPSWKAKKLGKRTQAKVLLEPCNRFANSIRWFFATVPHSGATSPGACCAPLNSHGIAPGTPVAVAPIRPTSPTASVLSDCDRAFFALADRLTLSGAVNSHAKHGHRADFHAADLSNKL